MTVPKLLTADGDSMTLEIPSNEKGIGYVIVDPKARDLIDGVKIEPFPIWPDDRGYFLEVSRITKGLPAAFPPETTQVSAAWSYAGTIKAFHYHREQTDYWVPARGMFQVALVDLRKSSPTFGVRNTFYIGHLRPWQLLVPPGIGHGYKVIGEDPGMLIYITNRHYNPKDEGRIPHNDAGIHYDWENQYK